MPVSIFPALRSPAAVARYLATALLRARARTTTIADEAYLRQSILEPAAKIVAGYVKGEAAMPSCAGILAETQIASLILYIISLR